MNETEHYCHIRAEAYDTKSKWVLFNTLTRLPLFIPSFLPKTETLAEGTDERGPISTIEMHPIFLHIFFMQAHDKHLPLLKVSIMHQLKTAQRWFKGQTTEENKDSQEWGTKILTPAPTFPNSDISPFPCPFLRTSCNIKYPHYICVLPLPTRTTLSLAFSSVVLSVRASPRPSL